MGLAFLTCRGLKSPVARRYVKQKILEADPTEANPFVLGLPTGSTPLPMYMVPRRESRRPLTVPNPWRATCNTVSRLSQELIRMVKEGEVRVTSHPRLARFP